MPPFNHRNVQLGKTMGLETIAISKAKWLRRDYNEDDDNADFVYYVSRGDHRRDGMKPGVYGVGKGGRVFDGWDGPYSSYDEWRRELCLLALGVEPEDVWNHPRRFRRKPFVELIDFPDCGNCCIGPETSAKLHQDFVTFAAQARNHFRERSATIALPARVTTGSQGLIRSGHRQTGLAFAARVARASGGVMAKTPPEDRRWMLVAYRKFRGAFRTASEGGLMFFW
jgi:hypothetical protein